MISTTRFIDSNIFIESIDNDEFLTKLNPDGYATSVLVLTETYHKLTKNKVNFVFEYIRSLMGSIKVLEITQNDLFEAIKNNLTIDINDKINIAVMKRYSIMVIISFNKDFDKDKTIIREEI